MRKIEFRGKRDDGEWLFGSLVDFGDFKCIWSVGADFFKLVERDRKINPEYIVDSKTIGQYTGLKDTNSVKIYEGDLLLIHQFLFEGTEIEKEFKGYVVYIEESACFGVKVTEQMDNFFLQHTGCETLAELDPFSFSELYGLHEESFRIIGNVHTSTNA